MRILYVANHGCGGNDDEGAITHALNQLGHDVACIPETNPDYALSIDADFLLFHKWSNLDALARIRMPKVFWYFDLVSQNDLTMEKRNANRMQWMHDITPLVDLGFCTDGDWVEQDESGKLLQLCQGMDERQMKNFVLGASPDKSIDILMMGTLNGGTVRRSFVSEMSNQWGSRFHHVQQGVHGRELLDLIRSSKIVVAPDGPITNKYWSNRVYLMLGMGAFLLHPYCLELSKQYEHSKHLLYYRSRGDLYAMLHEYLSDDRTVHRDLIARAGYQHTLEEHLYSHRCSKLIVRVCSRIFGKERSI